MVGVFAQTGGLTGGEIAVAGGTTARGAAGARRRCSATPPSGRWPTARPRGPAGPRRRAAPLRAGPLRRAASAAAAPAPGAADELRAAVAELAAARRAAA